MIIIFKKTCNVRQRRKGRAGPEGYRWSWEGQFYMGAREALRCHPEVSTTWKQRPEAGQGASPVGNWTKSIPGSESSKCKALRLAFFKKEP